MMVWLWNFYTKQLDLQQSTWSVMSADHDRSPRTKFSNPLAGLHLTYWKESYRIQQHFYWDDKNMSESSAVAGILVPLNYPLLAHHKFLQQMKGVLTCVLPDDDGPTNSVTCPSRSPPSRNKSILMTRQISKHYRANRCPNARVEYENDVLCSTRKT